MNKGRRKAIDALKDALADIQGQIETLQEEEQDYYDNMPESLQQGEKGTIAETAADALSSAATAVEEASSYLEEAVSA
jgi:uncharacterized coiled-coil DUF342 family protein